MSEQPLIIAVDDEEINLLLIEELAKNIQLQIKSFVSPAECLDFIRENGADILLVDYMMPEMDGIQLIETVHRESPDTLSVMITAAGESRKLRLDALEAGATEFLTKPIDGLEFQIRLKHLVELKRAHNLLKNYNKTLETEVEEATESIRRREQEALYVLSKTAEYKDPETGNHILRVAHYSKMLAAKIGMDIDAQERIFRAAPMHDVGKVGIPDAILLKPGRLTKEEFEIMKSHTTIGHDILYRSENPYLKAGAEIALTHHERWDGFGYPNGLSMEEIPISGRITAIADVFDALSSIRPYKPAWPMEKAFKLIENEAGKQFDPELASLFIENREEVMNIAEKFKDTEISYSREITHNGLLQKILSPAGVPQEVSLVQPVRP